MNALMPGPRRPMPAQAQGTPTYGNPQLPSQAMGHAPMWLQPGQGLGVRPPMPVQAPQQFPGQMPVQRPQMPQFAAPRYPWAR